MATSYHNARPELRADAARTLEARYYTDSEPGPYSNREELVGFDRFVLERLAGQPA